ncbi:sugar kinase [Streptacidiphilus carbonis]|uniref:sugar kinase n=1 Tax=Streptacidiphilus carbonis TaxID=105422 RepID=UPI0005AB05C1|nr:sugar kinase [Streptacidiphilus carbonis]
MPGLVTLGESMAMLCSPRPGPLRHAPHLDLSIAGAESNVAIGVRRLGHPAAWIGRVGADEFGALVLERLRAEQVDVSGALVDPHAPTGLLIKEQRTPDVTRVQYYRTASAGSRLGPADIDAAAAAGAITDADVLHITGITPLLSPSAAEAVAHAVKLAAAAGIPVSLDVNHRTALGGAAELRERLTPLLPHVSHLFGSEEELLLLADATDEPSAVARLGGPGRGPDLIVKRGARGASVHPADGRPALHRSAVPVRALDPVGAGDAFVAGYLSALLDGAPLDDRLRLGCLTGAFAVTVPSDWSGQPTRDELCLLDAEAGTTLR